jgi:hypothetical protein
MNNLKRILFLYKQNKTSKMISARLKEKNKNEGFDQQRCPGKSLAQFYPFKPPKKDHLHLTEIPTFVRHNF